MLVANSGYASFNYSNLMTMKSPHIFSLKLFKTFWFSLSEFFLKLDNYEIISSIVINES